MILAYVMINMHIITVYLIDVFVHQNINIMYQDNVVDVITIWLLVKKKINVYVINMLLNMIKINVFNVINIRILMNKRNYAIVRMINIILVE